MLASRERRLGLLAAAVCPFVLILLAGASGAFVPAAAGGDKRVEVLVSDGRGEALDDAVVYARPEDAPLEPIPADAPLEARPAATVAQIDKTFVPYVTAVRTGTAVYFPNHDDVLHNVYSFSPAKQFQLPLYRGDPPHPVTFDRPGVVAIGCNIHDWMLAYIYVLDTPFFARTDAHGRAALELPAGRYRVGVWHPRAKAPPEKLERAIETRAGSQLEFALELKPEWRSTSLPPPGGAQHAASDIGSP